MNISSNPCVVALDGEREVEVKKGQQAMIRLSTDGPLIVDVDRTMAIAKQKKILAPDFSDGLVTSRKVGDGFEKNQPN